MNGAKVTLPSITVTDHQVIMNALTFYIENEKHTAQDASTDIKLRNHARQNAAEASLVREKIR